MRIFLFTLLLLSLCLPASQRAVAAEDSDDGVLLEFGGAVERSLHDGDVGKGPAVGLEFTPLPDKLEIEAGVTHLTGEDHSEWETDIIFNRPLYATESTELEIGVGPEWVHATGEGKAQDSAAAELQLEWMVWPWVTHRVGFFIEPSYDYAFSRGHEQSLAVSMGLLIPLR